jgi:S1-C subfamily serine protease
VTTPESTLAAPFQVGLVCPGCQSAIGEGADVRVCPTCSITHHAPCWDDRGACSSYHCDPRTNAGEPSRGLKAEIVITAAEAARAEPPRPRAPQATADVAARHVEAPQKTRLAGGVPVALGLAAFAACVSGVALATTRSPETSAAVAAIGILLALAAGLAGGLAVGSVQRSRLLHGAGLAQVAILLAVACAAADVFAVVRLEGGHGGHGPSLLSLAAPEPPAPETFANAPAPIANAMRANVFVSGRGGTLGAVAWCGAGVILGASEGRTIVLTNRHVADGGGGASRLKVTFANGSESEAEVVWTAPDELDLALLACAGATPPDVRTRLRKTVLQVSEKVFAIGNPLALAWTYTEGVVSRVHEKRSPAGAPMEVVQSQTPIQGGNSGGGLYDAAGRLVGVNTWAADPEEGRGPGFSISVRTLLDIVPSNWKKLLEVEDD